MEYGILHVRAIFSKMDGLEIQGKVAITFISTDSRGMPHTLREANPSWFPAPCTSGYCPWNPAHADIHV